MGGANGFTTLLKTLKQSFDYNGQCWVSDRYFLALLDQMLCFDAYQRINPIEVLEHPFCTQT